MTKPLQPPTRERRLNALSAYLGDVAALIAEFEDGPPVTRIRTFSQVAVDDVSAALRVLIEVDGLGIVVHGARGCAGALASARVDRPWAVTNLDQRDTILGADGALARTLRQLHHRYRPWAIMVVATPVVAINNDDIQSVAEELSDELGIPIIELRTDGFRSRVAATGFDVAAQAIAALVPPGHSRRRDLVNLLAFERGPGLAGIVQAVESLGLEVNVFPVGAGAKEFAKAAQAAVSVAVFEDETDALRRELDRLHGVPFLRLPPPIGIVATQHLVAAIAAATERPAPPSAAAAADVQILNGRSIVVALPPSHAFAVAELVDRFGGELVGLSVDWIDSLHLGGANDYLVKGEFDAVLLERSMRYAARNADALAELDRRLLESRATARQLMEQTKRRAAAEADVLQVLRQTMTEQEAERQRIAREMHDNLGQSVTLVQLGLDSIVRTAPAHSEIADKAASLKRITHDMSRSLHRIAWEVRPTALDALGLEDAIGQLVAEWEPHCSLTFDLHFGIGDRRLPPDVESALYRVIQEGITNVVRHAHATRVGVILETRGSELICIVEDDGCGVPEVEAGAAGKSSRRLGLLGMRERLALVNGTVELESHPEKGTALFARVPLG